MKYSMLLLIPFALVWAQDPVEPLSGARVVIGHRHAKGHAGKSFSVTYQNTVSSAGKRTAVVFKTPVTKRVHMFLHPYASNTTRVFIEADPTVALGEETAHQTILNRNRGSSNESTVLSYEASPTAGEISVYDEDACVAAGIGPEGEGTSYWAFEKSDTQHVEMTDNAALTFPDGDWTIAGWLKKESNAGSSIEVLVGWGEVSGTPSFHVYIHGEDAGGNSHKMTLNVKDSTGLGRSYQSDALPGSNTNWQHITIMRDGATLRAYFDGVADTNTQTVSTLVHIDVAGDFVLGTRGNLSNYYLEGFLSEWAKWDRALTTGEITALAAEALPTDYPADLKWYTKTTSAYDEEIVPLTVTNQGSTVGSRGGGGGGEATATLIGNTDRTVRERVFEADTLYVIYLEAMNSGDTVHGFKLDWYEHPASNSTEWYEQ